MLTEISTMKNSVCGASRAIRLVILRANVRAVSLLYGVSSKFVTPARFHRYAISISAIRSRMNDQTVFPDAGNVNNFTVFIDKLFHSDTIQFINLFQFLIFL